MNDTYLWYQQIPQVDLAQYTSAEELLEALKVSPDRYSYITSQATHEAFYDEGTYEGFGFSRYSERLAYSLPLRMHSATSVALPNPTPTRPSLSPETMRAEKLKRRPPLTTLAQRLM